MLFLNLDGRLRSDFLLFKSFAIMTITFVILNIFLNDSWKDTRERIGRACFTELN